MTAVYSYDITCFERSSVLCLCLFILSNKNKKKQFFNGKVDDRVRNSKLVKGAEPEPAAEPKAAASAPEMPP